MCGIVGYVGHRAAQPLLVDGLARLEYRGYDSAGVSLIDEAGIRSVRSVGNLAALRDALASVSMPVAATAGIAHTRWATHGDVTTTNAHPHVSCDGSVHIVLNGIVEVTSAARRSRPAWLHLQLGDRRRGGGAPAGLPLRRGRPDRRRAVDL